MAETVHLSLNANGEDIHGDSTQTSLGREATIECIYFEDSVVTAQEAGAGVSTGRRKFQPLRFRKRIDRSSPLLARALCNNEVVEGTFRFYRPNPAGDGTTEHFFTVEFKEGRIAGIERISPDCIDPTSTNHPPMENVSIVFGNIRWVYEPSGVEHEDSWRENQ